jgi:arginyl-tRNA synthetase
MKSVVSELVEKGVATKNEDGSVGIIFPEETKIPSCILAKRDGTHGYLASDLAATKYRMTNGWDPTKIFICTDIRQQLHIKQVFTTARMAWPELLGNTELFNVTNGFIKLKEGAMSTRKGIIVRLQDLIEEGFSRTKAILEEKGQSLSDSDIQAIAIGAIKYSYLAVDREKDIVFDWDKALSFEGNSGPYIQYSYVRAKNIVEKAGEIGTFKTEKLDLSEHDRSCLRRLSFFDKAVLDSATKYKPHILATYYYELASEFNAFYVHTPKILEEQDADLRNFRLNLIQKVSETLQKGFELLAIEMPGKM